MRPDEWLVKESRSLQFAKTHFIKTQIKSKSTFLAYNKVDTLQLNSIFKEVLWILDLQELGICNLDTITIVKIFVRLVQVLK